MSGKITTEEANRRMLDFVGRNISGIDNLVQIDQDFHIFRDGMEFWLMTTPVAIRGAAALIAEIKRSGNDGVPVAVLDIRSTSEYEGELLRPAVYVVDGKNRYYRNKKELTAFEQALVAFYGPLPYYNPSEDCIQTMRFIRIHRIPISIQELKNSEDPRERQRYHIHEGLRERTRKISIVQTIKGPFTLEAYERQRKPLVARIIPYQP